MADRFDFYFRQRATEAEIDLAFAMLEKADRDLAADLNIYGIVSGAAFFAPRGIPRVPRRARVLAGGLRRHHRGRPPRRRQRRRHH
jgi:hypothetical protein